MANDRGILGELRQAIERTPAIGAAFTSARRVISRRIFDPARYWEQRYRGSGTSGPGSYGRLAEFKAEVLNAFMRDNDVLSVMEFGCGDGNQLSMSDYPSYTGLDVAPWVIEACQRRFHDDKSKNFILYEPQSYRPGATAEAVLSLDVIYHLTDDRVFNLYMEHLFAAATRFVIIYSDDVDSWGTEVHVRHRQFSKWINEHRPNWRMSKHIPNRYPAGLADLGDQSWSDFWIFEPVRIDEKTFT